MDIAAVEQSFGELLAALGDIVVARSRGAPADPAGGSTTALARRYRARRRRFEADLARARPTPAARPTTRAPSRTCAAPWTGSSRSSRPRGSNGPAPAPAAEEPAVERARATLYRRFGAAAGAIRVGAETLDRLTVLSRLATEPDPAARRSPVRGAGAAVAGRRRRRRRGEPVPPAAPIERRTVGDRRLADRGQRPLARVAAGIARADAPGHPGRLAIRPRARPPRAVGLLARGRRRLPAARAAAPGRPAARAQPRLPDRAGRRSRPARDRLRRLPATRPAADPGRVHDRHGRLGGRPAGDRPLDAAAAMGLRDVRDRRPRQPRRAAPRERPCPPRGGRSDPAGVPRLDARRTRPSSRGPRTSSAGTPPSPPGSGAGSARPPSRARPSSIATGR